MQSQLAQNHRESKAPESEKRDLEKANNIYEDENAEKLKVLESCSSSEDKDIEECSDTELK